MRLEQPIPTFILWLTANVYGSCGGAEYTDHFGSELVLVQLFLLMLEIPVLIIQKNLGITMGGKTDVKSVQYLETRRPWLSE
jgi:hypothetical protein